MDNDWSKRPYRPSPSQRPVDPYWAQRDFERREFEAWAERFLAERPPTLRNLPPGRRDPWGIE